MVDQRREAMLVLNTPAGRAFFVRHVNRIMDVSDIRSLVPVDMTVSDVHTDDDNPTGEPIGKRYAARLEGGLLPGQGAEGQRFVVEVKFVALDGRLDRPAELILQGLCVGLKTPGRTQPGDVTADITDYMYNTGISGSGRVPMDNFPVEWRKQLGNHAMGVVAASATSPA